MVACGGDDSGGSPDAADPADAGIDGIPVFYNQADGAYFDRAVIDENGEAVITDMRAGGSITVPVRADFVLQGLGTVYSGG